MKTKIKSLFKFLDAHKFTQQEIADVEYVAEKVYNFFENEDLEISDETCIEYAKQYKQSK